MLRLVARSSFVLASIVGSLALAACSTDVVVSDGDPSTVPTTGPTTAPTTTPTTAPTTAPTTTPPVKVNRAWTTVALPDPTLSVAAIDGSSKTDVWIVASAQGAASRDPWSAYHYDGAKWTTFPLTASVGRPSFGVAALAPQKVFLGFSYSAEVFELAGGDFSKKAATFSVTDGYSMSKVGDQIFVGTQENFGAGPLYRYDGTRFAQVALPRGGGVSAVWGASADDVWIARGEGLGHLAGGKYEDAGLPSIGDVHGSAKDDVWAVGRQAGVRRFDGTKWSTVAFPGDATRLASVHAFAKDDVVVLAEKTYRWDGAAFTVDARPNAPKSTSERARVGKDEAWFFGDGKLYRLAPEGT